jgi:hypothetical protein
MATGLKLPVGVDPTGRGAMVDGEDENRKIIKTALSDCDNDHAFQQEIGLGIDMVFDINDSRVRARIVARLTEIFRRFEDQHRFKLRRDTIRWEKSGGELTLNFVYHDIESDEEKPFARTFTGAAE